LIQINIWSSAVFIPMLRTTIGSAAAVFVLGVPESSGNFTTSRNVDLDQEIISASSYYAR
jgi:hypothetical protein